FLDRLTGDLDQSPPDVKGAHIAQRSRLLCLREGRRAQAQCKPQNPSPHDSFPPRIVTPFPLLLRALAPPASGPRVAGRDSAVAPPRPPCSSEATLAQQLLGRSAPDRRRGLAAWALRARNYLAS